MNKKFMIQIVVTNQEKDIVEYRDTIGGDFDTREKAEACINTLVNVVPMYDYRIDERYTR